MPWNGSGTYSPPAASFPEVNGTVIDAGRYNPTITDAASGITNALAKDGQNVPVANLPMGGFKHTGAADAAAAGQYAVYAQAISFKSVVVTDSTVVSNGLYLPAANTLGLSSNTTLRWSVSGTGNHVFAAPSSGDALAVTSVAGTATSRGVRINTPAGAGNWAVLSLFATGVREYQVYASTSDGYLRIRDQSATADRLVLTDTGTWTINAPSAGVALSVAQAASTTGALVTAVAGQSADVTVAGNGNGAGTGLQLQQDASSNAYLANRANATLNLSTNGSVRASVAATGGVTVNAPSSGDTLTLSGVSGSRLLNAAVSFNGSTVTARLANDSNNPASDAMLLVGVAGSAGGDPYLRFSIAGAQDWVLGADNDNSDAFTLSAGSALGTTTVLTASTSRNVAINAPTAGVALTVTGVANSAAVSATTGVKVGNSANTDTTVLDWYEEGTFTPVAAGTSTAGTANYTTQLGRFTRIGRKVFFDINIVWNTHTGTGNLKVTGLPYATSASDNSQSVGVGLTGANVEPLFVPMSGGAVTETGTVQKYNATTYASFTIPAAGSVKVSGSYEA